MSEVTWIYEVTMDFYEAVTIFVMWSLRIFSHDSFFQRQMEGL